MFTDTVFCNAKTINLDSVNGSGFTLSAVSNRFLIWLAATGLPPRRENHDPRKEGQASPRFVFA